MFMKRLKHALTKPQDLHFDLEYKLVDSGLVAICIVFLQYLISVEKPDELQTISLVLFSIAIPFLAAHFFISKTMDEPTLPVPVPLSVSAYLAKSLEAIFLIGVICTGFGIASALTHSSLVVSNVFMTSCAFVIFISAFIKKDYDKAIKREIKDLEMEISSLELERGKLETEKRELELENEKMEIEYIKLALERGKLELEQRNLELERDTIMKP